MIVGVKAWRLPLSTPASSGKARFGRAGLGAAAAVRAALPGGGVTIRRLLQEVISKLAMKLVVHVQENRLHPFQEPSSRRSSDTTPPCHRSPNLSRSSRRL